MSSEERGGQDLLSEMIGRLASQQPVLVQSVRDRLHLVSVLELQYLTGLPIVIFTSL